MGELSVFLEKMFPAVDFENENALVNDGLLDSLDLFMLVAALQREYKISIPMEELSAENFNSISSIYALICRLSK